MFELSKLRVRSAISLLALMSSLSVANAAPPSSEDELKGVNRSFARLLNDEEGPIDWRRVDSFLTNQPLARSTRSSAFALNEAVEAQEWGVVERILFPPESCVVRDSAFSGAALAALQAGREDLFVRALSSNKLNRIDVDEAFDHAKQLGNWPVVQAILETPESSQALGSHAAGEFLKEAIEEDNFERVQWAFARTGPAIAFVQSQLEIISTQNDPTRDPRIVERMLRAVASCGEESSEEDVKARIRTLKDSSRLSDQLAAIYLSHRLMMPTPELVERAHANLRYAIINSPTQVGTFIGDRAATRSGRIDFLMDYPNYPAAVAFFDGSSEEKRTMLAHWGTMFRSEDAEVKVLMEQHLRSLPALSRSSGLDEESGDFEREEVVARLFAGLFAAHVSEDVDGEFIREGSDSGRNALQYVQAEKMHRVIQRKLDEPILWSGVHTKAEISGGVTVQLAPNFLENLFDEAGEADAGRSAIRAALKAAMTEQLSGGSRLFDLLAQEASEEVRAGEFFDIQNQINYVLVILGQPLRMVDAVEMPAGEVNYSKRLLSWSRTQVLSKILSLITASEVIEIAKSALPDGVADPEIIRELKSMGVFL